MKIIALTISLLLLSYSYGQKRVALQSNGSTTIYSGSQPYVDAYNDAISGDTIYLPGGQLNSPTIINKSITVFGAGHHPNNTPIIEKTIVSAFQLQAGADSCHFQGLNIDGTITIFANIEKIKLKRNRMTGLSITGATGGFCDDALVEENVITGSVNLLRARNIIFRNNIVKAYTWNLLINVQNNAWITNNIIIGRGYMTTSYQSRFMMSDFQDCLIENNIFYNVDNSNNYTFSMSSINNVTFNNNVFSYDPTVDLTNDWHNNYTGIDIVTMFDNYLGSTFDYDENYNLVTPALYQGTNGNEVGIYGGYFPAKQNTIPENPHFLLKNIATETNASGELQVEITVEAQNE